MTNTLTVTQLISVIKKNIENTYFEIVVLGEISAYKIWRSGHWYFDLKDSHASIPVVMFKTYSTNVSFSVEDGMEVIVKGCVSIHGLHGRIQIIAKTMSLIGVGALSLNFEQLKKKLAAAGFFELNKKKTIPFFSNVVGIVTSPQGAALQDMLKIFNSRMPNLKILLSPTRVQGSGSVDEISKALKTLDSNSSCDVIIIARGGGSLEDLSAFNEEVLAKTIFDCKTPIITAIGHETDFTIADFVSDFRCATPTHAAQIVVPDKSELLLHLARIKVRFVKNISDCILIARLGLTNLSKRLISPSMSLRRLTETLKLFYQRLIISLNKVIENCIKKLQINEMKLKQLDPICVLARGYSIVYKEGKIIKNTKLIRIDDKLAVQLSNGILHLRVEQIENEI